ncbi:Transcription factor [Cordyceps fumosorosea ARSEF 2679]|uniref:Transcription factor n=1 Tax=Cordyceps fumosorosea (strain ARSEF 2679) TaxID=1081104 RepID=A0A162MEQ6_CORFA|nr:Transcription factor [Cordyceps fumosorosea ARSEF 2679]OAA55120.1 Transcription factor [Cordyceps fumosorosea ARSEF 2679]
MAYLDEGRPTSPQSYARRPLSCSTCRVKKIRCDKRVPCCHCAKANLRCTFPAQRKPRERKPHLRNRSPEAHGQEKQLADRLRSLEAQVSSLQTQLMDARAPPPRYEELVKRRSAVHPRAAVSHIKSSFWASINFEAGHLLQGFLQQQLASPRCKSMQLQFQYNTVVAPAAPLPTQPDVSMLLFKSFQGARHPLHHPPETHMMLFWHVFKENVEPMVGLLHCPTMANLVERALWHRHTLSTAEHTLLFSMYYVSAAAMGEEAIIREFSVSKSALLSRMRVLAEHALVAAKFASAADVTVLQAAMLFVLVLRKTGGARSAGSLVGVIVHLAQCLRLHKDGADLHDLTPFETEMRRRLFWSVVVLDQRSAEDLGTDPLLPETTWDAPLPLNINDEDICEGSPVLPEERAGMTDMTFFLIRVHTTQTSVRVRRLASEEGQTLESLDELCEEAWRATHSTLRRTFVDPNPSHELAWAAEAMTSCIVAKMKLTDQCSFFYPPGTDAHDEASSRRRSTAQLAAAIRVLEQNHAANADARWSRWRWIFVAYARCHGSAVLLTEMLRRPWAPVSEQGWAALHAVLGDSQPGELEDQRGMMPLPFGFVYELTRRYRESEYERLRGAPEEARRLLLQEEEGGSKEDGSGGGSGGGGGGTSGADRPGVSASSLERWRRAAGLGDVCVAPQPRGLIAPEPLDDYGEQRISGLGEAVALSMAQSVPEMPSTAAAPGFDMGIEAWPVGEMMPVEYMESILDELF